MHWILAWFARHPEVTVTAVITFLLACWKRIPVATRTAIEARMPRTVNVIRVGYALFPDLVKAAAAARAIANGQPKTPPDLSPPPTRAPTLPPGSTGALLFMLVALAGCGGSWEQQAHRGLVGVAHVASAADVIAADLYATRVATLDAGAEYTRQRALYVRVKAAQLALRALLIRGESYLDDVTAAGGDAGVARCLAARALVDVAADAATLRNALVAVGAPLAADALATEHELATVAAAWLPRCDFDDAGTHTPDGGTPDA